MTAGAAPARISGEKPARWLTFRLSAMGDVALCTGVLDYWGRQRGLRFIVATRAAWAPLFAGLEAVDQVIGLEPDQLRGLAWLKTARELAAQYRGCGLLDLHGSLRAQLLTGLWSGPVARAPKFRLLRWLALRLRSPWALQQLLRTTVPQRYALALEPSPPPADVLRPRVVLRAAERAAAAGLLGRTERPLSSGQPPCPPGNNARPLAALHPYATHASKAWPMERWRVLTCALDAAGWDWFLIGRPGPGDPPLFPSPCPANRNFIARSDLRLSCALLAQADVLVTADSGPMHLAVAVDTPVVALFGPTHRAWGFAPGGPHDLVLECDLACRPCSLHGKRPCPHDRACLNGITSAQVLEAMQAVRANANA